MPDIPLQPKARISAGVDDRNLSMAWQTLRAFM
jgi:hypothetical protein